MTQPIVKQDIEARVKDTGDVMTGTLYIDAELGLITGSETQTSYSGMQATRLCTADDNNINTAGFIINSTGESKFLHRRGNRSTAEDAYFQFDGTGFSFFANGTKGGTPVNSTPVFQALQTNNRPQFNGKDLALYDDALVSSRAYILGNDTEDSGTWFKLATIALNGTYQHYRLFFTASETDSSNTPTELCIYVATGNTNATVNKTVTIMSAKYDDIILNNLYILLSSDTYISGTPVIAEIWFYKSSRYSSYTINNIYEMRRNNTNPTHWTFNEGNTKTPLSEPTSGYSQYKAINILNGWSVGSTTTPIYIEKNIPKSCGYNFSQYLPLSGGTMTGQLKINRSGTSWVGVIQSPTSNFIYSDFSSATSSVYHSILALKYANHTFSIGGERASEQFGIYIYDNTRTTNGHDGGFYVSSDCNFYCSTKLYGAVWNDYAEFREYKESAEPPYGRVVIENGDDTLSLSTERLQPGGNICSDTFGFAIGETDKCKMPIAVSGRALVYTYEDKNSYQPGEALCTGPNGTVSRMTREEIKEYPDYIIGYVSSIPSYERWGTGDVEVDGRIWIKVV